MINTKRTGSGTVIQTIQDELFTPLKTQRKMRIQVTKVDERALRENDVGSDDSMYCVTPASSTFSVMK